MSKRRRLARERLEIYLVHLLLAYRPLIFTGGVILSLYAVAAIFFDSLVGSASLLPALFLLMLSSSYRMTLYTARLGAWIGTLGRYDD
jgi:hypothetical protein